MWRDIGKERQFLYSLEMLYFFDYFRNEAEVFFIEVVQEQPKWLPLSTYHVLIVLASICFY